MRLKRDSIRERIEIFFWTNTLIRLQRLLKFNSNYKLKNFYIYERFYMLYFKCTINKYYRSSLYKINFKNLYFEICNLK